MELGKRNFTARPCERASSTARRRSPSGPSTLTSWGVWGTNWARVESRAARWNTAEISNSLRIRSSRWRSRMSPTRVAVQYRDTSGSSGRMSRARMSKVPSSARRVTRPCPISPPAPVTRTTDLRVISDGSATTWLRAASVPVARARRTSLGRLAPDTHAVAGWNAPSGGRQPALLVYLLPHLEGVDARDEWRFAYVPGEIVTSRCWQVPCCGEQDGTRSANPEEGKM